MPSFGFASLAALLIAAAVMPGVSANAQQAVPARIDITPVSVADSSAALDVELFVGESRLIPMPGLARVAVGNGRMLSASVLDDRDMLLIANDAGSTTVHLWTRDGRMRRMLVNVRPADMARVTREILDFLGEQQNVRARVVGDKVLVEGQNLSDEQLFKLEELAKRYPQIVNFTARLGWERMILLDVRVVEFKREKLRELGVKWSPDAAGPSAGVAGDVIRNPIYTVRPPAQTGGIVNAESLPYTVDPFQWYFGIVSVISSRLNLYERNGDALVLAAPQLTARSGSSAKFQSGGEIPYAVVSGNGSVNVQFKNYGIILEVKPRADSSGAIRSEILAEVSEPDSSLSLTGGVPGLRTRRTQTEFNVRAGETMVLSGLIDRRQGETIEKVPGLGNIPILGHLFKSKRFVNNETELVIFVTPTIVTADAASLVKQREELMRKGETYLNPPSDERPAAPSSNTP